MLEIIPYLGGAIIITVLIYCCLTISWWILPAIIIVFSSLVILYRLSGPSPKVRSDEQILEDKKYDDEDDD